MAKPFLKGFSFSFTLNNPKEGIDPAKLFEKGKDKILYAVWQLECGKESKIPHYQGHVRLVPRQLQYRIKEALAVFDSDYGSPSLFGIIISELASIRYAQKGDETYRAGPWKVGDVPTKAEQVEAAKQDAKETVTSGTKEEEWGRFWKEQCLLLFRDLVNDNMTNVQCAHNMDMLFEAVLLRKPFKN